MFAKLLDNVTELDLTKRNKQKGCSLLVQSSISVSCLFEAVFISLTWLRVHTLCGCLRVRVRARARARVCVCVCVSLSLSLSLYVCVSLCVSLSLCLSLSLFLSTTTK